LNSLLNIFIEKTLELSTSENCVILEPFIINSSRLLRHTNKVNKNWIGIGETNEIGTMINEYEIENMRIIKHKYSYNELRYSNAFLFEKWIIKKFYGVSNIKQHHDKGIDGKTIDGTPIQVKRQDNIGRNTIDNFKSAISRYNKILFDENINKNNIAGYVIAFSFGQGAIDEVERLKKDENINIKLITVDSIVDIIK
jgi:site-specific DNA-methyltransferase (adenine-specific)